MLKAGTRLLGRTGCICAGPPALLRPQVRAPTAQLRWLGAAVRSCKPRWGGIAIWTGRANCAPLLRRLFHLASPSNRPPAYFARTVCSSHTSTALHRHVASSLSAGCPPFSCPFTARRVQGVAACLPLPDGHVSARRGFSPLSEPVGRAACGRASRERWAGGRACGQQDGRHSPSRASARLAAF